VKVLIATDGSQVAHESAARAGDLLADVDAVTVLAVVTDLPGEDAGGIEGSVDTPEEAERILETEQHEAEAWIEDVISVLPEAWRPRVTKRIEGGDAGPMITWVAEHEHSDVIVVGSHGHGVLKRMLMGSVSQHVVHHAPCPVLLVRASHS
jgi:nucleotide-binding universal stress UspA family protein